MLFGKLDIDPAKSPAVLDTATWDHGAASKEIVAGRDYWPAAHEAALRGSPVPRSPAPGTALSPVGVRGKQAVLLAALPDGQQVFLQIGGPDGDPALGKPFFQLQLAGGKLLAAYPTDAAVIDAACRTLQPRNAPRALGRTPRLGIGCRLSTRVWPAIFAAMEHKGFSANSIQNSVRELNLLEDLKEGREPERNYASGFGMIESGYTGSTFEGLWVAGVLAALQYGKPLSYGADADHIQIKRADHSLERAMRVVNAARYYTFFTLDMADVLSYESLSRIGAGEDLLRTAIPNDRERRDVLSYHLSAGGVGADEVGRLVGKYWRALDAASALGPRIAALRAGSPFDLEFAFDEHPPEISGPDCITGDSEVIFVTREIHRRGLPVTHVAPNFGVEKSFDYRLADGREGLMKRVAASQRIAESAGFTLDFHSADDLTSRTRRVIGKATGGRLHYKISPMLHFILAETVRDFEPRLFLRWWDDALGYARTEAEKGSPVAAACLAAYATAEDPSPSPTHEVFRQFFFAFPGRRDAAGRFVNREQFYSLSPRLYAAYHDRVTSHLGELSEDLFVT
jgi:hypothetical protein